MFNHHDITRNAFMLHGPLAHHGYDWWWHNFTARDEETGEDHCQLHRFFSLKEAKVYDDVPYRVSADDCIASETLLAGSISITEAFAMYWHAEGMKSAYKGEVVYNGRKYIVSPDNSYGYADKNWGRDFTSPWVWLSSNCLKSKKTGKKLLNSVFDIGGGRK